MLRKLISICFKYLKILILIILVLIILVTVTNPSWIFPNESQRAIDQTNEDNKNQKDIIAYANSIELSYGKKITLYDLEMNFELLSVEDSRCPKGATCIWAGEGKAKVKINKGNETQEVEFIEGKSQRVFGFDMELTELIPFPSISSDMKLEDYKAKISIKIQ